MANLSDISAVLQEQAQNPASTIRSGNGQSKFKAMKILDSDGQYHGQISYLIDKNTTSKIEDDEKLYGLIGYTLTDEAKEVEERQAVDFSKIKIAK